MERIPGEGNEQGALAQNVPELSHRMGKRFATLLLNQRLSRPTELVNLPIAARLHGLRGSDQLRKANALGGVDGKVARAVRAEVPKRVGMIEDGRLIKDASDHMPSREISGNRRSFGGQHERAGLDIPRDEIAESGFRRAAPDLPQAFVE